MANRTRKFQGYSMSDHAVNLIEYIADKTMAAKSRLVEKAVLSYYADYLKELEAKRDGE